MPLADGLRPAAYHAQLGPYLRALLARREYISYVASSQLRAQRMTTVLGNLWHLLNPALQIAVSYVIFGLVLKVNRGVDNFIAFLTVGIFAYQFTNRATMMGAKSVVGNANLMRSFVFPRAMLPVTAAITATLAFLPTVIVMLAVPVIVGEPIDVRWLALPLIIALQVMFNTGASFVAARATFHVPDIEQVLPFMFRLAFYASGVLFLVDEYVDGQYRWLFIANPLYGFVALYRWSVLGYAIDPAVVPALLVATVLVVVVGFAWFRAGEDRFGRG